MALRGPVQSRLAESLTPNSLESSLTRQTLSSPPALRRPDLAERPTPGLSANEFLKSGLRLVPIWVTLLGSHMCFHGIPTRAVFPLVDHVLPSLWCSLSHLRDIHVQWGPMGYFIWVMSLNLLWEEVTPQCASSKRKGMLSQCYSSPTVWVALGTAVVDLLCVERGPIVCLIGRVRRPTQAAGRGSSCGALVRIPIRRSSDLEWLECYIRNISVTYVTLVPWRRERKHHVPSPQLLYHRWATGSPAQLLSECMN